MSEGPLLPRNRALLQVTLLTGTVLVAGAAYGAAGPHRDPRFLVFLAVLAGSILVAWLANSVRPHPALPVAMAAAGLAGLAASNGPIAGFGVLMALISAGRRRRLLYGGILAALVVVLFEVVGSGWRSPPLWIAFEILGFSAALLGALGARRVREEQARTRDALAELEVMREVQARAARVAERVRMAREVHDDLGQTLSALARELEGAGQLLVQRPQEAPALAAVERAQRLARQGMEEARRAAGTLRGDPPPGPALLTNLVSDFERDSGTAAHLRVDGQPVELAPEARLAVYRAAQEALVNVGKHARATQVDVRLRYQPDGAELIVENDGGSGNGNPPQPPSPGGHGLAGIRERAELLGGRLETGPTEQGFRVRLWVPAGRLDPEIAAWFNVSAATVKDARTGQS